MRIQRYAIPLAALAFWLVSGCAPALSESAIATQIANQVLTALASEGSGAPAATATLEATAEASPAPAASETPARPVVVFLAEGTFSEEEKSQIRTRVVEPFIHYHADLESHPPLASISIERSSALTEYPFSANAIFETGITMGWLVPATGGTVDWWIPECMVACVLSDSFRAAYPQIVATLEP